MTRAEIIQGLYDSGRASLADAVKSEFSDLEAQIARLSEGAVVVTATPIPLAETVTVVPPSTTVVNPEE